MTTSTLDTDLAIDDLAIDTVRFLAADMVQRAGSGHPGLPLGAAPMAWTLFSRHLRHDPADPRWPDRDRFVLSAGHGSALLYALLHVFGYPVSGPDLAAFRQLGSSTPGHPEYGHTPGVETTTGPLGQGLATAVGMALAEQIQGARFPGLADHRTFALVGDGCLMEGISHESASLAGRLRLGKLIVLFDDNDVTIDGAASSSSSDDHLARFAAYNWHTEQVDDGTDLAAIDDAIQAAIEDPRPSLVAVRTTIGHGAPGIEGTPAAHGSPLGAEVIAKMKAAAGWHLPAFEVPDAVAAHAAGLAAAGAAQHNTWQQRVDQLTRDDPDRADRWNRSLASELAPDVDAALNALELGTSRATRQSSQAALKAVTSVMPELIGGSADLAGSTGTDTGAAFVDAEHRDASRIAFGIREHAMAAVLNGLTLHGGLRAYGSTFLVFSDYLRPALRLSALMGQPVIYVLTHDSVAVGEDGPTHQPVEHIESLRLIPGVRVLRPADDVETVAAWRHALHRTDGPTVLVLTRQTVPSLPGRTQPGSDFLDTEGGRVVRSVEAAAVDLIATGSEVALAVETAEQLEDDGIAVRVLSAPWRERFFDVRDQVFGRAPLTVGLEAGTTMGWRGVVDVAIGIDQFGASGRGSDVLSSLGLSADAVADRIRGLVEGGS